MSEVTKKVYPTRTLTEIDVEVGDEKFKLRAASNGVGRRYREEQMLCNVIEDGKVVGFRGASRLETLLVAGCLFRQVLRDDKLRYEPVREEELLEWPDEIVTDLYAEAKKISKIGVEGDAIEMLEKKLAELKAARAKAGNSRPPAAPGTE